jgi:hypothetical protein
MTSVGEAALAASVIVGMISIPAVSQTSVNQNSAAQTLPNISQTESQPRQVTRQTSSNGFYAAIDTAMQDFSTFVSADSSNATLENSVSELSVSRSSDSVEWVLETPEGRLEIRQNYRKTVETAETPYGTLKKVKKNGAARTSFQGSDRQKVEKIREKLRDQMQQKKQEIDQKRQELKQTALPKVEVMLNESLASGYGNNTEEHVVIINQGSEKVSLDGWKLQNKDPETYSFKDTEIEAGQKLKVYSSEADELPDIENAVYNSELTWHNSGDTATLKNDKGIEVAEDGH